MSTDTRLPRVVFSVSSLGLGHATRSLPLIRAYCTTYEVHVLCTGGALRHLKQELAGVQVVWHDVPDYPPLMRGSGVAYYAHLLCDAIVTLQTMRAEHRFIMRLARTIDPVCIIADGRYGSYVPTVPSFIICHQIHFILPRGLRWLSPLVDAVNVRALRKFTHVLIPDFEDRAHTLSGLLSHHLVVERLRHTYVGILSSLERRTGDKDISLIVQTHGFLAAHKHDITDPFLTLAAAVDGRKVLVAGFARVLHHGAGDVDVIEHVHGEARRVLYARARAILMRSGYTSIMDVIELGIVAAMAPTPGQTEQEYLAEHLREHPSFLVVDPAVPDRQGMRSMLARTEYKPPARTADTVRQVRDLVDAYTQLLFFSIVVPVHNEEKYLARTLDALDALEYPRDRYEVLVVENGSTDTTANIARRYVGERVRLLTSERGVSRAKNAGMRAVGPSTDWIVLLDADTVLAPNCLRDLDRALRDQRQEHAVIGTTEIEPLETTGWYSRAWFRFYNLGHRITKTSYALQLLRSDLRDRVWFDESRQCGEDLAFIKAARTFGSFVYVPTRTVRTSVRRFERVGWLKLFVLWNWHALVRARSSHKHDGYEVIR